MKGTSSFVAVHGEKRTSVMLTLHASEKKTPELPKTPPTLGFVVAGAGVLFGGTGALLWGLGRKEHGEMEFSCAKTGSCSESDVRASRTKLIIGDVLVGAALVTLGIGIYLVLSHHSSHAISSRLLSLPYATF
jgi:hypothetical protein